MNKLFADVIVPGSRGSGNSDTLPIIIAVSAIVVIVIVVVSIIIAKIISNKNGKKHNWYSIWVVFCVSSYYFDRVGVVVSFLTF